jgi:hypothetical protein
VPEDRRSDELGGRTVRIEIREQTTIHRPAWEVREQFRDVTHHAGNAVHSRLRVRVLERRAGRCRYLLTSALGPLSFEHLVVLDVADEGMLVNAFVGGVLKGAFLDLRFDWHGPEETVVHATFTAELRGIARLFGPLTRRHVARHVRRLLDEDRCDLEAPRTSRIERRVLHPSLG